MTPIEDFSIDEWKELLADESVFKFGNMLIMRRFVEAGGESTCSQLSNVYGRNWGHYNSMCSKLAKRVAEKKGITLEKRDNGQELRWPVLFNGRSVTSSDDIDGSFIWSLKPNLKAALEQMELSKYEPLYEKNELDALYDLFNKRFPIECLDSLTLDEYTNLNDDYFCTWVERKTQKLGSIQGATSFKFGIYRYRKTPKCKHGQVNDDKYGWQLKFGETPDDVYAKVRKSIVQVAHAAERGDFSAIDEIEISPMFKWKVAFLYSNKSLVPIYDQKMLVYIAEKKGLGDAKSKTISQLQNFLMNFEGRTSNLWDYYSELLEIWKKKETSYFLARISRAPSILNAAIKGNYWAMQQRYEHEEHANAVTNNLKVMLDIREGDVLLLADENRLIAYGKAVPTSQESECEASLQTVIKSNKSAVVENDGVVVFDDCEVYYEKRYEGFEGDWSQFIDVEKWKSCCLASSVSNYGVKEASDMYRSSVFRVGADWAKKKIKELDEQFERNMTENDKMIEKMKQVLNLKKNIILQGAPGTGKTYMTATLALSVIGKLPPQGSETEKEYHEKVMSEYEKLLIKFDDKGNIVGEGQIGFVTFHQSMDYEDFVEGIKPITDKTAKSISYEVQPGIFKRVVEEAKFAYVNQTTDDFSAAEEFDVLWTMLVDDANEKQAASPKIGYETKSKSMMYVDFADENSIVMLGEGATTTTTIYKSEMLKLWNVFADAELEKIENFNKEFRKYVGGNETAKYALLKYMQSIRGKNSKQLKGNVLSVENKKELVGKLLEEDFKKTDVKNYVLIIDEINRGNVSKIFGELISLLEADKRDGGNHPLSVTLPYSKEKFSVPSNLYIIGTMNTTDRSVGSIDYAVRRRFAFVTLEADKSLVPEGDARNLFDAVKNFIEKSKYDMDIEDLMVGHSYFMDSANLQMKWQYEILPLLMEYHKDGIISKSPLKDAADKDISDVKKDYANFTAAWKRPDLDTQNS